MSELNRLSNLPVYDDGTSVPAHPRFELTKKWDARTAELEAEIRNMYIDNIDNVEEIVKQMKEDQEQRKANDIKIRSRSMSVPRVTNMGCPLCDRAMVYSHFKGHYEGEFSSDGREDLDNRVAFSFVCHRCGIATVVIQRGNY